ncbi:MAG: tetratricopeptide repeat protein [Candidatus Cloacimonetes bacterium]|nr:tetratricopeptide repeat protein [Candidatus Cloacimonadota bacterium]
MEKSKIYFGIFQDGFGIKVAVLAQEQEDLKLLKLVKKNLPVKSDQASGFEGFDQDLMDNFSFGDSATSSNDFGLEENNPTSEFEMIAPTTKKSSEPESVLSVLSELARELGFTSGSLAINLDLSNVTYKKFEKPPKSDRKKLMAKISKEFYEKGSSSMATFSFIEGTDESSVTAIGHEGRMELLENLMMVSNNVLKKKFTYKLIQPNEIVLMNTLRYNYDLGEDQVSAIIYIGLDHSRITLMKGPDFLMELPIINEGFDADDIIKTIYSRFMLERSHLEIPSLDNIFLAGENINSDIIQFIKERELDANVELLLPKNVFNDEEYLESFSSNDLTEFIIPIMLAATQKNIKSPLLYPVNFIPKQLLDQQNIFSISIPGFIVLGLVLVTTLFGMYLHFQEQNKITKLKANNTNIKSQISINQTIIDSINSMEQKITELKTSIQRSQVLVADRNQNHFIYEVFSDSFSKHPLTWARSIVTDNEKIELNATTTQRRHILKFSSLFPSGRIGNVVKTEVEGYTAWDFTISYDLPDAIETKRIDLSREGIVYVPEEKKPVETEYTETESNSIVAESDKDYRDFNEDDPSIGRPQKYIEALELFRKQEFNTALTLFEDYKANNDDIWARHSEYFIAECNYGKGNFELARRQFLEIIDRNEVKIPDALVMIGNTYIKLEQPERARAYWEKLIKDFPKSKYVPVVKQKLSKLKTSK